MAFIAALTLRAGRLSLRGARLCVRPCARPAWGWRTGASRAIASLATDASPTRTSSTTRAELTATSFADMALAPPLLRALEEVFKYEAATEVQARSVPLAAEEGKRDLLVKAKTGTGKTIAFVLPALHHVLTEEAQGRGREGVRVLVVSPTRELALQIAEEAAMLARFAPGVTVQAVVGGTNVKTDVARFRRDMPTLLVATPGRLIDHLLTPSSGFGRALAGLQTLVMDEADRLLDMGFRPSIERILTHLPPVAKRQTLLFSATMPADVRDMTRLALKPTHEIVDCVGKETSTHATVEQIAVVAPLEDTIAAFRCELEELMAVKDYKILVFFGTARQTQLYAELWNAMNPKRPVLEIHSRKTQSNRNRTAETFRKNANQIMFSSDVTARGLDFPDGELVLFGSVSHCSVRVSCLSFGGF